MMPALLLTDPLELATRSRSAQPTEERTEESAPQDSESAV